MLARYVARRVVEGALTVLAVATAVFLLLHVLPGDPVEQMLGDAASSEDRAALRRHLRLDLPITTQYGAFLGDLAGGTMGRSFRQPDETVASRISEVLPDTVALALAAVLVAWSLALPLGVTAATRRGTAWDRIASASSLAGLAMPAIWLGPLLILLFAVKLRVLPLPGDDAHGVPALVLPAITLGAALAALLTRMTRASMLEVLNENYVLAARARGLGPLAVTIKHALRTALLPVVTVGGAQLGAVLGGTLVTEKIFERPGLGTLFLEAFLARDIPVVQGCVLVVAALHVGVNLGVDLLYAFIDPRVRLA
ncbi:MAG: ABC transporter permease [Deltaproteobacteria bacterium]|nr:ABC transporter permease [Deltaproteobacteria bacterium]